MQKNLDKEAIEELRLILQEDYGLDSDLSDEEIAEYGHSYIELGRDMLNQFKKMKKDRKIYSSQYT